MKKTMDDKPAHESLELPIDGAMVEAAYRLHQLGSDFVGAAAALQTVLNSGDLRASYATAIHVSNWARQLSKESTQLRASILDRAREQAKTFLEETNT